MINSLFSPFRCKRCMIYRSISLIVRFKTGKVVVVLSGKYAGRKAAIVKIFEHGTSKRPYPHAIVAGVDRYPLKVTKAMSQDKIKRRTSITPFVKVYNFNHLMPTRYLLDAVQGVTLDDTKQAVSSLKTKFEERYRAGQNSWFFTKLRF
ncbi:hypothetical protein RCL1_001287 [Eukaryota sp. TZLM3-RCL]